MRKLPYLLMLLIAVSVFSDFGRNGTVRAESKTSPATLPPPDYISPTPGKFPIIAWNPYYIRRTPTRNDFQQLVNCGFNSALISDTFDKLYPLAPLIKDLDVSLIVNLDWFFTNHKDTLCCQVLKQLRNYVNKEARPGLIGGYLLTDEPRMGEIPNVKAFLDTVTAADPAPLPWVNLVGEPADAFMTENGVRKGYSDSPELREKFKEYLSRFCDVVNPSMLSYDFYPIMQKSADSIEINFKDFYYDLALFAHTAKARGIPFWVFCETANYISQNPKSPELYPQRPVATEEYLRFEAFNALALGAQGIVYWAYAMQDPNEDGYYRSAVVDKNGNHSLAWDAVTKINREIREHSDVFLGATLEGYMFVGDQYKRPSEVFFIPAPLPWQKCQISRRFGKGALVSRLSNKGKNYIAIVNQDPLKSSTIAFTYYRKHDPFEAADSIAGPIYRDTTNLGIHHVALKDSIWSHGSVTRQVSLKPSQYIIYQIPDSLER